MFKIALKLMVNKVLTCLEKMNMLDSKIIKKVKLSFMIYADFVSSSVPRDNEK